MFRLLISMLISCALVSALPMPTPAQTKRDSGREGAATAKTRRELPNTDSSWRFITGERTLYKIEYSDTSVSDFSALFKDGNSPDSTKNEIPAVSAYAVQSSVRGELEIIVLEKNNGGALVACRFRETGVRLRVNDREDADQAETIRANLSLYVFAVVSSEGRIVSVRFDKAVDNLAQGFARTLLALTQFVFPTVLEQDSPALPSEWTTQEDDPAGIYIARYQAMPDLDKTSAKDSQNLVKAFSKTKVRYLPRTSKKKLNDFEVSQTIKPGGKLTARFDLRRGQLISLSGTESRSVVIAGKIIARGETFTQLDYLNKSSVNPTELTALRKSSAARNKITAAVPLSVLESEEASESSIQRAELGNATTESLLADLAKIESSTDEAKDKTSLYLKFKALVYLHPEASAKLGKILSSARADSATMLTLSGALSVIGHPKAQQALIMAIRSHQSDWAVLSTLIPALGTVRTPINEAEDTLRILAFYSTNESIATTAQLALGAVARNLADKSPGRAAKIVRRFIREIEASSSERAARETLLVLGNTGSALALPTIARFIAHRESSLRAAAVSALRWINADEVNRLLIKTLGSDSDDAVRLEAAAALGFHEINSAVFAAQKRSFIQETAVKIRLTILKNLWKAREAYPEVRQLVKQSAAQDAAKEIRETASGIIADYPEEF